VRAHPAAFLEKSWSRLAGAERVATFAEALGQVAAAHRD
jgi:hypothetical protein